MTPNQLQLLKEDLDSIIYSDLTDSAFRAVENAKKRVNELIKKEAILEGETMQKICKSLNNGNISL